MKTSSLIGGFVLVVLLIIAGDNRSEAQQAKSLTQLTEQTQSTANANISTSLTVGRQVRVYFNDSFWSTESLKPNASPNVVKLGSSTVIGTVWSMQGGYVGISSKTFEDSKGDQTSTMTHWVPISQITKVDAI